MPTPFYHLSLAQEIIDHPDLPKEHRTFLEQERCAFFLGKTAPDVQSISGQKRSETHFFTVPPRDATPPWERLLARHGELSDPSQLFPSQAAFIAGYLCHLQADLLWIHHIYQTFFNREDWEDNRRRYYLHNALRAYLDTEILIGLPEGVGACVGRAQPDHWLPFTDDADLMEWRDFLAEQLAPGANVHTAEIFAIRMGVDIAEFAALIASQDRLEKELFVHISRQTLVEYRLYVIQENLNLLASYLSQDRSG